MGRREEPIPALSSGLSHVVLTGLLVAVALPQAPHPVQPDVQPAPEARVDEARSTAEPAPAAQPPAPPTTANTTTPRAATPVVAEPPPDEWPQSEVTLAREQCMHLLSGVPAEIDYMEPIRKGQCGLPAPVRLKSVGSGPDKVKFDPPVQVNCRMVAALAGWVKTTLQPEARTRLKSDVVRIIGASGYACRNIYHRPNARLSQHALANAVDIGAFGLKNGRTIRVLKGWGLTARDIKARAVAKAKAEAEAKERAKAKSSSAKSEVAKGKDATKDEPAGRIEKPGPIVTQASLAVPLPKKRPEGKAAAAEPAPAAKETDAARPTKEALFLRAIHKGACTPFGTVLGPEANDPHRDHFHLDLTPRRSRGYCR